MVQRINGGVTTVKKLDMVSNLSFWAPAAKAYLDGASEIGCPLCKKGELKVTAVCGKNRIGFLLLTCPICGKSANFSRIKFPESIKADSF